MEKKGEQDAYLKHHVPVKVTWARSQKGQG